MLVSPILFFLDLAATAAIAATAGMLLPLLMICTVATAIVAIADTASIAATELSCVEHYHTILPEVVRPEPRLAIPYQTQHPVAAVLQPFVLVDLPSIAPPK